MVNKQVNQNLEKQFTYLPPTGSDLIGEFVDNNRSYQLFIEKGLDKIQAFPGDVDRFGNPMYITNRILDEGLYKRILAFLSTVDSSKGPIERKVERIERRRDLDLTTRKMTEHLVVHVRWVGKDYNGDEVAHSGILEGMHNEPVTRTTVNKGKRETKYFNWIARYDIPFTPETVNTALEGNLNPPELVNYFVRVSRTQRDGTFSLEQFRDSTFEQLQEISRQGKGLNR